VASSVITDGARSFQLMNTASQVRYLDQALFATGNANGLAGLPRSGVIPSVYAAGSPSTPLDLYTQAQSSPNLSVQVLPGAAFIGRSSQGGYLAYNSTSRTLTVSTPSTTLPRIDLVYYIIRDQALGDAGAPATGGYAQVEILAGTPASSPAAPALPANAIPLAQIAVAANASSITQANITQVRKGTALAGAVRALLEGDSLSDPGYRYGELRSRYHATYGVMVDAWGTDNQWHGTDQEILNGTWNNGTGNITVQTSETVLFTLTVPDPGFPYYVRPAGQFVAQASSSGGGSTNAQVRCRKNSATGTQIGFNVEPIAANVTPCAALPNREDQTAITGSLTLYMTALVTITGGLSALYSDTQNGSTFFQVELIPA
jgi:hypothetical protein